MKLERKGPKNNGAMAYQLCEKLNYSELQEACTGFHRMTGLGLHLFDPEGVCILTLGDEPLGPSIHGCLLPGARLPGHLLTPVTLKDPVSSFQLYKNPLGLTEALYQPGDDHQATGYVVVGQFLTEGPSVAQLYENAATLHINPAQLKLTISALPAFDDQQLANTLAMLALLLNRTFQKPITEAQAETEKNGPSTPATVDQIINSAGSLLFEGSADAMFIASTTDGLSFKFLSVNAAYCRITGIDPKSIVDRDLETLTDLAPDVSLQKQITRFREVIRTCQPITYEETNRVPTGSITVEVTLSPITPTTDETRHILGVGRDITHLRTFDNLLKQSEENYYELFESSPEAVLLVDPQTNCILDANRKAIQLTGYNHKELTTKTLSDLRLAAETTEEGGDFGLTNQNRAVATHRSELLTAENTTLPVEVTTQLLSQHERKVNLYVVRNIGQQINYENAIKESEQKFRDLTENAPAIVFRYALFPEPHFEYVSQNCTAIIGYTPEEHYADPLLGQKIIHGDDLLLLEQYMKNPQPKSLTLRWIHKDGTIRWTSQRLHLITDEFGVTTTIEGYAQDITAEHLATEALNASESKFREYIEKAPDGIIICDESGRFIEVNQATHAITGYTESELLRMTAVDLLTPEERHLADEHFTLTRATGSAESTFQIHSKDKSKRAITVSTTFLNNNRFLSFMRDVTREKAMMETLFKSENDYRHLFEQAHDAIMIFRADDEIILEVNQHTCDIYGYPREELIGQSLVDLSVDPETGKKKIAHTLLEKSIENFETRHYRKDGTILILEARASVINYQGEEAILSINRDITARRNTEDLNRLDTELDNQLLKLYDVSMDLSDEELFEKALRIAVKTTDSPSGFLFSFPGNGQAVSLTFEADRNTLTALANQTNHFSKADNELWDACFRNGKPFIRNHTNPNDTPENPAFENHPGHRLMGFPVYCNGQVALVIGVTDKRTDYEPADEERVGAIAHELTKILEKRTILSSLRQREAQYRSLIDQIHVGIIVHDAETRIVLHNEEAARLLKLNAPELEGKLATDPLWHFIDEHGNKVAVEDYPVMKVVGSGKGLKDVVYGIASDHTNAVNWGIVNAFPEKDDHGQLQRIVVSFMDITHRKEAETTLLQLHERMDLATRAAPLGIWDLNLLTSTLVWDDRMFELYDVDPGDFSGTFDDWKNTLHPDDLPHASLAIEKALTGEKEFDVEFRIWHHDRSLHYLRGFAIVVRNGEGTPVRMTGINIDITDQRVAEETLKESNDFNQTLLHTIPFGIDIVDEEGNILFMNENLRQLFPGDPTNRKCWEAYRDDSTQCHECPLRRGIVIGETNVYESYNVMGGRILEINHTGMWFQGKKALLEIFKDITDRKKAEADLVSARNKAEEVSLLRSRLLANLSHEIRTPLNGIMGFSEYLNSEITDENHLDMINSIYESGSRLLDTLTGILDLSAYESKSEPIAMTPVSINLMVENRVAHYQAAAFAKGLPVEFMAAPQNPVTLTREDLVVKIIGHLISNAIKFTKTGKITVITEVAAIDQANYVFVKVTDTGIGIAGEHIGLIFEEFRQVSEGINRAYEGTGLGLHISQRFAQILGGRITVDSQPGVGSTFTLWVPLVDPHPAEAPEILSKPNGREALQRIASVYDNKPRILLVEDDDPSAILAEIILKKRFDLHRVSTGEEAITYVQSTHVDAILMDINLGSGISGILAVEKIHETPGNRHLPVAAVTANALDGHREEYLSRGCSHYLTKPYRRTELLRIIDEMIDGSS